MNGFISSVGNGHAASGNAVWTPFVPVLGERPYTHVGCLHLDIRVMLAMMN